jgi:putative Ca2+/H+ antiporter (TMEM165/GDT1 family)
MFIIFGVMTLINKEDDDEEGSYELKSPFVSGFGLILVSEMGDKTQLASALFATQYDPVMVFVGVVLALFLLSSMAVYVGKMLMEKINKNTISRAAGVLFIVIGISFFF